MIELKIMDICGGCPMFEADNNSSCTFTDDEIIYEHTISCKFEKKCQRAALEMLKKVAPLKEDSQKETDQNVKVERLGAGEKDWKTLTYQRDRGCK